jgi:hypothetical protein
MPSGELMSGGITYSNDVTIASSALPDGAATSALQVSGNSSLSSINTKTPALGQAAKAASQPVAIASDQATSIADGAGGIGLGSAIMATNFVLSSGNTSIAQLANGATFTGAIESVYNQQSVSVLVTSDKTGTLTLKQYIDAAGTFQVSSWAFTVAAGVPFSRAFTANGNYFNLTFTNSGGSTTTTLNINTAYGTLNPATNLGNMPVSVSEVNGTALAAGQSSAASSLPVTLSNENVQDLYFTGQSAQTATINNIIPSVASATATDCTGYRSGSMQIVCPAGTYTTGAIIFEGSNDNTNFQTIPVYSQLILTGTPIVAAITLVTTTSLIYTFPINFRYLRVRISTAVSGASASVQAFTKLSQTSWFPAVVQVAQATTGNLNATITPVAAASMRVTGNAGAALDAAVGTLPTNNVAAIQVPSTGASAALTMGNAASLTVANVKASAGSIYGISVVNKTAGVIYIQTYNTAGTPTLGTSVVSWFPVAASATLVINPASIGLANFATGIGIGASTTPTSTGTPGTAPDVVVWYK